MWGPLLDLGVSTFFFFGTAILGSWHCAGMCGPVSLLMGTRREQALYQAGRLFSYVVLGLLAGLFGATLLSAWREAPGRQVAQLSYALLILLSVWWWSRSGLGLLRRWTRQGPRGARPLLIGFLSGALPCGFLWGFLSAAALSGSMLRGSLILAALWAGGLPALMAFGRLRPFFNKYVPERHRTVVTALLMIASLWGLVTHL